MNLQSCFDLIKQLFPVLVVFVQMVTIDQKSADVSLSVKWKTSLFSIFVPSTSHSYHCLTIAVLFSAAILAAR